MAEVETSGLRGRGGAGFPTGRKWKFLPADGRPRYLVCNCDESEPGTFKDRALITYSPHMLIEGILIACHAIRARRAYVYVRGEYGREAGIIEKAAGEAHEAGLLRAPDGTEISITVHSGAGAYICGEATALLSSLEGNRGYPRVRPPFPAVSGAWKSPTIIQNVETLCNLPHIFVMGGAEYAKIGPPKSPGPKIYCMSGHLNRPGLYERPMDVTLRELIEAAGGVLDGLAPKAVFPGGSSSPVLRLDRPYTAPDGSERKDSLDLRMEFESVRAAGSMLGSAGVIVMHEKTCMVEAAHNLARFYHHESCGQCTPCREGTGWVEKILSRMLAGGGRPGDVALLLDILEKMSGTTICLLADSCAMPVASLIIKFREEFERRCVEAQATAAV
ncbi:MAG: NADH-quinone oxidoreductase subunit NuoF [Planctomycetota bacterium]|nr:NADH-quinone oxidoreductase subunit NuoF [Planctomycetota bacterium]